jgi:hypothetical protein
MEGALATTDYQIDLAAIDRQCRAESGNLSKFAPNTFITKNPNTASKIAVQQNGSTEVNTSAVAPKTFRHLQQTF